MPRPSIVSLLFRCRPFAIAGFIVAVIVDAVNAKSFRSIAHVIVEVLERIKPPIANLNAPASVSRIILALSGNASLLHSKPDIVDGGARLSMGGICYISFCRGLGFKTPARFSATSSERVSSYDGIASTVTNAQPRSSFFREVSRYYSKTVEFLTSKVDECRHNNLRKIARKIKCGNLLRLQTFGLDTLSTKGIYHV